MAEGNKAPQLVDGKIFRASEVLGDNANRRNVTLCRWSTTSPASPNCTQTQAQLSSGTGDRVVNAALGGVTSRPVTCRAEVSSLQEMKA